MLLKTGIAMMVFALGLTGVAIGVAVALRDGSEGAVASESSPGSAIEPLVRTESAVDPWAEAVREPASEPQLESEPEPPPEPAPRPEPEREALPVAEADWPMPTEEQLEEASGTRRYKLPDGAVMGLTIDTLGLKNVPVFDSDAAWALDGGVSHEPGTSMPWSDAPQTNVYLQGHRLGWPGTESHLVFYHLGKLEKGDEVLLRGRDGGRYRYKVSEAFVVEPNDSWVMGQVAGRDMVTLQTCTPIPGFDKRLIVRADRV